MVTLKDVKFLDVVAAWIFTGILLWILYKISLIEVSPKWDVVYGIILFAVYLAMILFFLQAVIWTIVWVVGTFVDSIFE